MGENSLIEWTDHSFNPWVGCEKVSPACAGCYAESWAKRAGHPELWQGERRRTTPTTWASVLRWDAAARAAGVRKRVFCASLADVFDNQVPMSWRVDLMHMMGKTTHLDWLLLTKRIGNASDMLNEAMDYLSGGLNTWDEHPWPGVYIGATIANQPEANRDIPKLLKTRAFGHFISGEPLLGPVDLECIWLPTRGVGESLTNVLRRPPTRDAWPSIDWVIVGGESGAGARPMHPEWARALRDQCRRADVPFFFKQWGDWIAPDQLTLAELDGINTSKQAYVDEQLVIRTGKKAAGRLLDGRVWNQFPELRQ